MRDIFLFKKKKKKKTKREIQWTVTPDVTTDRGQITGVRSH